MQVPTKVLAGAIKPSVAKQTQVDTKAGAAAMNSAGTLDMLAWLDAKIAAQHSSTNHVDFEFS